MILFIIYKVKPCSNIIPDVYIGYTKELGPGGACGDHLFQLSPLGRTRSTTIPGLWLSVAFVAAELRMHQHHSEEHFPNVPSEPLMTQFVTGSGHSFSFSLFSFEKRGRTSNSTVAVKEILHSRIMEKKLFCVQELWPLQFSTCK